MNIKDLKCIKIKSVNPLYLIVNKVNGYSEEFNGNRYLMVLIEAKKKLKKYEELWSKSRDLVRSITKNSDDYDEKL